MKIEGGGVVAINPTNCSVNADVLSSILVIETNLIHSLAQHVMEIHLRLNNTPHQHEPSSEQNLRQRTFLETLETLDCIYYPYWQYTNLFIFRFVSLLWLRTTLRLLYKAWFSNMNSSTVFVKSVFLKVFVFVDFALIPAIWNIQETFFQMRLSSY